MHLKLLAREKNQITTFQDAQDASLCPWRNKKQKNNTSAPSCLSKSSKGTRTHCQATLHGADKHRTRKLNSTKGPIIPTQNYGSPPDSC